MKNYFFRPSATLGVSFVLLSLVTLFSVNCRKFDLKTNTNKKKNASNTFNVKDAKEWWFGFFRKTKSYKFVDPESPLTLKNGDISNTRIPSWLRAVDYKIGKLKIVESPLYAAKQKVLIPGSENLTDIEKDRIASATLRRLIMVKTPDNIITARVVTIVPTLAYAKKYNYDISTFRFNKFLPNFDGYIFIGDWNESLINAVQVERGNVKRNLRIITKPVQETKESVAEMSTNASSSQCTEWVSVWVRGCIDYAVGDEPPQLVCEDWRDEGYFVYTNCENEGPTTPYEYCVTNGGTPEDCACSLLGIGCANGGGNGNNNTNNGQVGNGVSDINNDIDDPCIHYNVDQILSRDCKNELATFIHTLFGNNDEFDLTMTSLAFDPNSVYAGAAAITSTNSPVPTATRTQIKFNTSVLAGATQEYITAVIFHEFAHAYIDHSYPYPHTNAQQHNMMVSAPRFDALVQALLNMFGGPNGTLTYQDAVDLAWGGNYSTIAFNMFTAAERSRIRQKNTEFLNGTRGTPCQ